MARIMRLPDETDLPPGTRRDFAIMMFYLYRRAHRPALRAISDAISRSDLRGSASPETIRRMLRGVTIPAHWETVEAVYLTLCDLASLDPYRDRVKLNDISDYINSQVEDAWHAALDNPDHFYEPAPVDGSAEDAWAADTFGSDSRSDDPPF